MKTGVISAAIVALLPSLALAQAGGPPPTPPELNDEAIAKGRSSDTSRAYAEAFGVNATEAKDRLAAQDRAVVYAEGLLSSDPSGFVDLEIQHEPSFKIVVYYNKSIDRQKLTSAAPVELRRYLVFNPINKARDEIRADRQAVSQALAAAGLQYGLEFSLRRGEFILEIPVNADEARYRAVLPPLTRANISVVRGATSVDAAGLYGGYWFEAGGYCTAGWPIRNSAGTEGLLTAGHCGPPYEMNFSWNSERPILAPAWARKDELRGYQTLDHAMYPLGRHTTTRVINIENNRVYRGETNTVPGIVTAFYEIASPRQPVRGQYLCKMGSTTGLTCGIVADINFNGDGQWNVVKVSQSAQRHIAEGGDSGGPVFSWSSDGSMVHPIGIMKRTARVNDQVCRNSSSTASNNTTCYFTFIPLTTIRAYDPFQVNTVDGFRSP